MKINKILTNARGGPGRPGAETIANSWFEPLVRSEIRCLTTRDAKNIETIVLDACLMVLECRNQPPWHHKHLKRGRTPEAPHRIRAENFVMEHYDVKSILLGKH